MRSTFGILFYLNTSKRKKNGDCPVMGRVTVDGGMAQFSLKADVNPKAWDAGRGRMIGKTESTLLLNRKIERTEQSIRDIYDKLLESAGCVTAEQIKNGLTGVGRKAEMLLKLFEEHNSEYEKRVGIDRTDGTFYSFKNTFRHMSTFIKSKYSADDHPLKQLDSSFIHHFDFYLRVDCRMKPVTIVGHIIILRKIITRAIHQGTISRDPFRDYVSDKPEKKHRHITGEELQKLLNTPIPNKSLCFTRDMFIFACFTGLSYVDVRNLTDKHLKQEADGSWWIFTHRQKTGGESNIRLLDIPVQIIEKYRPERKSDKLFNMISGGNICVHLRKIETLCGIERHLQYHMSRHSFATQVCITQGVPIETLSKMMGHKSIRTTQIYTEITNQKVDGDMKKLAANINGKYVLPEDNMPVGLRKNQFF